jgi:hypothetical protein
MSDPTARKADRTPKVIVWMEEESVLARPEKGDVWLVLAWSVGRR